MLILCEPEYDPYIFSTMDTTEVVYMYYVPSMYVSFKKLTITRNVNDVPNKTIIEYLS